jgi:hypothetical protein
MIRKGSSWCDLVKHADGRVELVHLRGTTVVCEDVATKHAKWTRDAEHELLYLSAAADRRGRVAAGGQSHDDGIARVVIDRGFVIELGLAPFPFGVLLRGDDDGWTVFVQRTADWYDEIRLTGAGDVLRGVTRAYPAPRSPDAAEKSMPPTSQGFLYVAGNGQPITQDQGRGAIPGLTLPSPAPSDTRVWAGQSASIASIALFDSDTGNITPLGTPGGQPPHIVESGGTFYVCSYVAGGAWLSSHRRPFAAVMPPPVEPPPPLPVEPPKEIPLEFELKHTELMEMVNARFPAPVTQEVRMRDWTRLLAEQFAFSFPAEGWGCKSTSRGSTQSFDVMARQAGGRLWGYDLAFDGGSPRARLNTEPEAIDLAGQAFIPVTPVNHLGAAPPVTPPTPPPVTPPAARPFPAFRWPEDVFLYALTRYINEGLYDRDKPVENPEGTRTASRGAFMWFVPIATEKAIALISSKGNHLPTPAEWWRLADDVAAAAIDFYRRNAPPR